MHTNIWQNYILMQWKPNVTISCNIMFPAQITIHLIHISKNILKHPMGMLCIQHKIYSNAILVHRGTKRLQNLKCSLLFVVRYNKSGTSSLQRQSTLPNRTKQTYSNKQWMFLHNLSLDYSPSLSGKELGFSEGTVLNWRLSKAMMLTDNCIVAQKNNKVLPL